MKSKLHASNIQWHRIYVTIMSRSNQRIMRKYLTKASRYPAGQTPNLVVPCLESNGLDSSSRLQRTSLGRLLLPVFSVCSFPCQESHRSGTSNSLESLTQPRLHLHNLTQWRLRAPCPRDSTASRLSSKPLPSQGGRVHSI